MPFVIVGLVVLVAILYGAVRAFQAIALSAGLATAVIVAVVAVVILVAVLGIIWRRHRAIYGQRDPQRPTHVLQRDWGSLTIWRSRRSIEIKLGAEQVALIFADVKHARPFDQGGRAYVDLSVNHEAKTDWRLPMDSHAEAKRWCKILELARDQKL